MQKKRRKHWLVFLLCLMLCLVFATPSTMGETEKDETPAQTQEEKPTAKPTEKPTPKPTERPTEAPTPKPTEEPTPKPTERPTEVPTPEVTEEPAVKPTAEPQHTPAPTHTPAPSTTATLRPTHTPELTEIPVLPTSTSYPTSLPTQTPTEPTPELSPSPTPNRYMGWYGVEPHHGGGMEIPKYYQTDYTGTLITVRGIPRSVATSGCGPTCLSMVVAYITGNTEQDPESLFLQGIDHGYYNGSGFSPIALRRLGSYYGVKMETLRKSETAIKSALRAGKPVIVHLGPGIFTKHGHYVVLRGLTSDGKVLLNDPVSTYKTGCAFPIQTLLTQATGSAAFMACSLDEAFFALAEEPTPEPTLEPTPESTLEPDVTPTLEPMPMDEVVMESEFVFEEEIVE